MNVEAIVDLIRVMMPERAAALKEDTSLVALAGVTEAWAMSSEQRLEQVLDDRYAPFKKQIILCLSILGLRKTIRPKYKEYYGAVILGSTGLSHYKIWRDLVTFIRYDNITIHNIFLLGGDRKICPPYDIMDVAYKFHPNDFYKFLSHAEILSCQNEMELMELITSTLKLPKNVSNIPHFSVFTKGKMVGSSITQADTKDTIITLRDQYQLPLKLPMLFLGTMPHIVRQGVQAELLMLRTTIDVASRFVPYLETCETTLKGELPLSLYLDELHWLVVNLSKLAKLKGF